MLCPVFLEERLHVLVKFRAVFLCLHVYEVHYHYSAHVPESQLTGYLVRRQLVDLKSVLFLISSLCADAAVDVYDVQGFRGFNDQIGALFQRDHFPE